jgi:hypothetical protein
LTARLSLLKQQNHYPQGGVPCSLASSLRMVVPLLTATSRRRAPFTWCCVSRKAWRSSSRPSLPRRPVFGRVAASPTSSPLDELASALHDKSTPGTTSPTPTSAWAQTHGSGIATDAHGGANLHITREQQLAAMQTTCPGKSLNAGLTSRAAITSPSSPTLPHARLNPRHSNTLYDAHEPRLRLGRGNLGKHSGRLRQAQTTRGEGQTSRRKQSNPATRRFPRQGITTRLQCTPMDGDVRRDVPAAKHCNSFFTSPCAPPLVTIKGRGGQQSHGLDLHRTEHHHLGPGNELPLPTSL